MESVMKHTSQVLTEMKESIYKELWNDEHDDDTRVVFNTNYGGDIVISRGRISFDNGESFIPRNQEKLIAEKLNEFEVKLTKKVLEEYDTEEEKDSNAGDSFYDMEIDNKSDSLLDNLFEKLSLEDHLEMSLLVSSYEQLKILNEQIELVKELKEDKQMLLNLLNEKRELMKSINSGTSNLLNKIN